jgi:hypothetical protein
MKLGYKILFLYIFINYVVQYFIHIIYPDNLSLRYNLNFYYDNIIIGSFIFLITLLVLEFIFPVVLIPSFISKYCSLLISILGSNLLIFIFLICSIYIFINYGVSVRHSSLSIKDLGFAYKIHLLFKYFMQIYFYFLMITCCNNKTSPGIFKSVLLILFFMFSISGSNDTLFFLMVCFFILMRNTFNNLIIHPLRFENIFKISNIFIFVSVLSLPIYVGILNKNSNTSDWFDALDTSFSNYFIQRISTSFSSLLYFSKSVSDISLFYSWTDIVYNSLTYRLNVLLDFTTVDKPDITSISSLNFNKIHKFSFQKIHGGMTPGLLSTGFIIFPYYIGFFILASYTFLILRLINNITSVNNYRFSLLFLPLVNVLFNSPLDNFIILDTQVVFACSFIFLCLSLSTHGYKSFSKF